MAVTEYKEKFIELYNALVKEHGSCSEVKICSENLLEQIDRPYCIITF